MKMKTKNFLKRVIAAMLPVLLLGMYSVPCFAVKPNTAPTFGTDTDIYTKLIEIDTEGTTTAGIEFKNIKKEGGATTLVLKSNVANAGEQKIEANFDLTDGTEENCMKVTIKGAALQTLYGKNEGEVKLVIKAYGSDGTDTSDEGLVIVDATMKAKPKAVNYTVTPASDEGKITQHLEALPSSDTTLLNVTVTGDTLGENQGLYYGASDDEAKNNASNKMTDEDYKISTSGITVTKKFFEKKGTSLPLHFAWWNGTSKTIVAKLLLKNAGTTTTTVAAPNFKGDVKDVNYIYNARNKKWYKNEVTEAAEVKEIAESIGFEMEGLDGATLKVHVGNENLVTDKAYDSSSNDNTGFVNAKVDGTKVVINKALFETVAKITGTNEGMFVYAYATKGTTNSKPVLVAQFTVVNGELEASLSGDDDFGLAKAEASDYDAPKALDLKIGKIEEGKANVPANAIWSGDISLIDGEGAKVEYDGSIKLALTIRKEKDATWNVGDKVDVYHVVDGNAEKIAAGVEIKESEGAANVGTVEFTSEKGLSPFYITPAAVDSGEGSKAEQSAGQQVEDKDEASKKEDDKDTTSSGKGKSGSGAKTKTGDATFALQGLAAMITTGLGLFVMKRKFRK